MRRDDTTDVPTHHELMRIQVETLFTHDPRGRMHRVNEPGGAEAPRFFLGRTVQGRVSRFGHEVDDELARALELACASEPAGDEFLRPPHGSTPYEEILARAAPVQRVWAGPAYRFPRELPASSDCVLVTEENAELLRPHLEPWLGDVAIRQPMLVLVTGGRAVSVCCSVRKGPLAHEAGLETASAFRGRGYALPVVAAWTRAVRGLGRIPLYSTSWENGPSRAVAHRLGLLRFGTNLHLR